ncbi:hypothetical protein acdb102_46850 [Acidothermaceae bacterium B102]|nr:hypothetical protein acdb102_46850 [Acidothermaceae bacterium B102]
MRKTIWALPLAFIATMAIGIPSASAATGTVAGYDHFDSPNQTQVSSVFPMNVGDCTMFANLRIRRPNSAGIAQVQFEFNTSTTYTTTFDQWHSSWKIYSAGYGSLPVATVGKTDGVRMPTANVSHYGVINTTVAITLNQWFNISAVTWTGSC